jgi:serine/threonine-protein kinase
MDQPSGSEIQVGAVLGETYEITALLGAGGMGAVFSANHLRLPGKRVAVKVLHGQAAVDRESYARFRREAEIASRLGHPNIVEVLDWNTLPSGTPYLILEYLDGEDLATRLARGPLPLEVALHIARQIASALHAAHRNQVVHRDLKPGNVFLVPADIDGQIVDRVKVLDFGISKIRGSQTVQTQDSILLGTPQYMAPEQAEGKNDLVDQRSDLFALGAIVYEMLAGRPAFSGNTLAEVIFKVVYQPVPPLAQAVAGVPAHVVGAVERAMSKEPSARHPDVATFIAELTGKPLATIDRFSVVRGNVTGAPTAPESLRASVARGEVVPATRVGSSSASRLGFFATAIVVGAAGTFGVVRWAGRPVPERSSPSSRPETAVSGSPPSSRPSAVATPEMAAPAGPAVSGSPPSSRPSAVATPEMAAPAGPAVSGSPAPARAPVAAPPVPVVDRGHHAPASQPAVPAAVAADLDQAEQALAAGDKTKSITLARHTLMVQKTSRAFSIMTRAQCAAGNLEDAKAAFHSVTGADRARVIKACHASDIDLR